MKYYLLKPLQSPSGRVRILQKELPCDPGLQRGDRVELFSLSSTDLPLQLRVQAFSCLVLMKELKLHSSEVFIELKAFEDSEKNVKLVLKWLLEQGWGLEFDNGPEKKTK